jgi:predicted HTH domain antitoxin
MRDIALEKMKNLTVRIDEETFKEIDETAERGNVDRSTAARQLLRAGIKDTKRRRALDLYRQGGCTLWRAAQLADLPLRAMIELAATESLPVHFSPEDVDEAWREASER